MYCTQKKKVDPPTPPPPGTGTGALHHSAISLQATEPREFKCRWCSECKANIFDDDLVKHQGCKGHTSLGNARVTGPDMRVYLGDDNLIIDVTTIAIDNITNKDGSPEDALKRREADKDRKYLNAVKAGGESFLTLAVSSNGSLGDGACKIAQMLARQTHHETPARLWAQLFRRLGVEARAKSLLNAEKRLGVDHPRRQPLNCSGSVANHITKTIQARLPCFRALKPQ